MTIGAAKRVPSGKAVGVDIWLPHALTGNSANAVIANAEAEGVAQRVETRRGNVLELPFDDGCFDVIVSNFVVHEVNTAAEREQMLREIVRVLKPGGRLALADFIFTDQCVAALRREGLRDAARTRLGRVSFWAALILNFGFFQLYLVTARKNAV